MAICGIGQSYYQNSMAAVQGKKHAESTEQFAVEKTGAAKELSEAQEMELFKREFYEDLSKVTCHATVSNAAVNISDAAFQAMKDDPEYRQQVLSLIQRDWGGSYAPRNSSVLITVGATLNEYRGDSWPVGYDSEFALRSQNSFYKRSSEAKDKNKELLDEYLRKRAQAKKQQQEAQRADERTQARSDASSAWAKDMVILQPPNYTSYTFDDSIAGKPKDEMTMDEYKQWFMNEMSRMPVSAWYRSTCVGGALTITEECFERMKNDPEWENTVLGMVRNMYSSNGIMGSKMIGYQVIGATPEECHGAGIPVKDHSSIFTGSGKSWWQRRHERMEELIKEQGEAALQREKLRRAEAHEKYLKSIWG